MRRPHCGDHRVGPEHGAWARDNGWEAPPKADAKELADAAKAGDPVALRAFRRGATAVAAMIASVGAVCDLDRVVIGGGVAKSGALLFDPVREALASTPAWTSCAACACCPPNSAVTRAWSARRPLRGRLEKRLHWLRLHWLRVVILAALFALLAIAVV